MKTETSLINFNVPITMKERFDKMCQISARTRTSVLVELMETFIIIKGIQIEEENKKLKSADRALQERSRILRFKEYIREQAKMEHDDFGPLSFYFNDGQPVGD